VYDVLTVRVAARYLRSIEFPSEQARKDYLQEHPGADPSKHTVKEHDEVGSEPTGLSEKAKSWLSKVTGEVKSFFTDTKTRQEGLSKAAQKLREAPAKAGQSAIEAVKKQVAEAKDAFQGVKAVMSGGSMSDSQKTALKKVVLKAAAGIAAGALVAAFPATIAHSVVGKSVAKHVAKTVLNKVLGQATGTKLAAEVDAEAWLGGTLATAVADVLSKLGEEDINAILELAASEPDAV
jgi:hypothetical protein